MDQERRNSVSSEVSRAHPPLPIVHRTWSRTHITHSEVTAPFPLRLHSEQIKRHWLSQLPFWRVHLQRTQHRRWALRRWPRYFSLQLWPGQFWSPQAGTTCIAHSDLASLGLTAVPSCPALSSPGRACLKCAPELWVLVTFLHALPFFPQPHPHLNDYLSSKCLLAPKPMGYIGFKLYLVRSLTV